MTFKSILGEPLTRRPEKMLDLIIRITCFASADTIASSKHTCISLVHLMVSKSLAGLGAASVLCDV